MLLDVTPLILTFNEAPNIRRTLAKLAWARQIVVVDSFSTDDTLDILRSYPTVRVVQRPFDTFAEQCNFGLQHIESDWVLSLDADYILSDELVQELKALVLDPETAGYCAQFRYCIAGRALRASLYPPRVVLYQRRQAQYRVMGHGHRVHIDGKIASLDGVIYHDDRKPLDRWLREQNSYMLVERQKLLTTRKQDLDWRDRIRQWIVIGPALVFLYTLIGQGLILDGWPGWFYVCQRTVAELLLSLRLIEVKLSGNGRTL